MRGCRHAAIAIILVAWMCASAGCESAQKTRTGAIAHSQAPVQHVVLISLKNPNDAEELIAESTRLLTSIPSVESFACGKKLDTGRPQAVGGEYDVGYVFGFEDVAGYRAYEADARHQELLTKWKPRIGGMKIFDFGK